MMNKIEKLLDLCIAIAEKHLNAPTNQPTLPSGPIDVVIMPAGPVAQPVEEPKKPRKPRAPKTAVEDSQLAGAKAAADAEIALEDQLGMGADEPKKELTEEGSKIKMEEVTKQFVSLCKNDKPEDGKTVAIRLMKETFKVQKLGELTHEQRLSWIKEMEKGILNHK